MEENIKDSKVYEVGFLLVPTLSEEEVPTVYGDMKELVASLGGEVISDEMPKMTNLAYTMSKTIQNVKNKFDTAYFGWTKFFMDADKITDLKKKLDFDPKIIRFLIIKTVKENTIASKKFASREGLKRKAPVTVKKEDGSEEVPTEINKEEVDKEIDAMVAE
ncbi:MAG TPA: 30S ribosomal protein S6 [Candidatus Paceibacterota bacterium]|nr:30S ribosomal protein S6 [Candidatus Paceibacterota bacterium]